MKKLILLIFICHVAFAQSDKILVTDLTKIKSVTDIAVSSVANKAIYTLKTVEPNSDKPLEYDYVNNLFLIDFQNPTEHIAITRGGEGASQAEFSPDGQFIAFTRTVKEKSQVFIMSLKGGEPWQLTNSKYGASSPKFSIDGKKIFFSSTISMAEMLNDSLINPNKTLPLWSTEKPGFITNDYLLEDKKTKANPDGTLEEIRAYLQKDIIDKKAKVITRLNFQGEAFVEPEIKFSHIAEIEVKENVKERYLTSGFGSYGQFSVMPDGQSLIITTQKDADQHPDREQESKIVILNLKTGKFSDVYYQEGKSFAQVKVNKSGKQMAMIMNTPNLLSFGQLCLANTDGSNFKIIDFDRVPSNLTYAPDQKSLYFTAASNGGFPLFKLDLQTLKVQRLSDYESGISVFDITDSKLIYVKNDINNPGEIYISDLAFKNEMSVSNINTDWLKNKNIIKPEKRVYSNKIGQKVEYWIMKPANAKTGKKYPLMLQLHGGPTAMWGPGEPSMWHEFQYFCAQGYGVVYLNQRGSGGYGKEFQFSNYRDWGSGPQEDALAACSDAAKEAWVDTSKMVITGGSYAGYLTAWIIAHDHRFKAAFAQRGVYDLTTFMGEANAWRLVPNYFGLPWQPESETKIDANSPYTFIDKINTPFLIKHGENDLRTGVAQSEMMFKSLKILNREVEYVRMPGATHELSRSGNVRQRIDRILRIYEFFERYISR
jgi:dipeptidyl aminopeptidase/acylaminoacyl peptidase